MEYKNLPFEIKEVDDSEGIFKGYASTYDLDRGGDIIVKGAFDNSLATNSAQVKILWQHKQDQPIGKPMLMRPDDKGLYVEGKVSDTSLGRDAKTLMRDGVITSMSIGFITKEADYNSDGVRLIKELELVEFSLVTYPMNEKAVITQVKNALDVRELEAILREAGYSKAQATKMASVSIKSLREADEESKSKAELNQLLSNLKGFHYGN
jgi:HK97 family phage prohead protease